LAKRKSTAPATKLAKRKVGAKSPAKRATRPVAPGDTPPSTAARIDANNRERRTIERAIDSARDKTLAAYRTQFRRFVARHEGVAKTLFAEGDSWFNYPLGHAVISQLQGLIHTPIANFAWPGAETRQLLGLHERQEIQKRLKDGPEPGRKWDVLLFSGGGDDIVGDQMVLFLDRYDPTKPPETVLNKRFEEVLDLVMGAYQDLVKLRDQLSRNTLMVAHSYDYAWATGQGACWLGPWLKPSLDYVGVPQGAAQHAVVGSMLKRFETRLQAVATAAGNFLIVPTPGTLKTAAEWANELHPKDPGFGLIARKFQAVLQQQFGANI
jgi:nitroreductase